MLIGCDGVKSVIRKQLFESLASSGDKHLRDLIEPKFTGTVAYRGLIPANELMNYSDGHIHNILQRPTMVRFLLVVGCVFTSVLSKLAVLRKEQGKYTPFAGYAWTDVLIAYSLLFHRSRGYCQRCHI